MRRKDWILVLIVFFAINLWGQENSGLEEARFVETPNRPSVALVLSGAGPRGFAHIPIIELMEELEIPIDLVLGTSSGAIVGGLYSAGYSGEELAQTVLSIDWTELLQDQTTHVLSSSLESHSTTTNLLNVRLDGDYSLNIGGGLLTGQYVYSKFKSLTVKIPSEIDFDSLPVAYRATAVDLVTGDLVIIDKGDLAEAMRASMSLPGAFEPFPIDGRYYLDGFIRNTLPIGAVRDLGYDIVIAVEISDKVPESVNSVNTDPFTVINQVLALQQAVVTSQEYEYADLVLFPDLTDFGSADYAYSKEIYERGKVEAEQFRDELLALREKIFSKGTNLTDTAQEEKSQSEVEPSYRKNISYSDLPFLTVDDINLINVYPYDEKMILQEFEKIRGKKINEQEMEIFLKKIYETSNYIMVVAQIISNGYENVLDVEFYQKEIETIRIGAMQTFEGTLSKSASWEVATKTTVQLNDFLGFGGVLSIQGTFLNKSGIEVVHMQPLSDKMFLRSTINAFQIFDIEHSGFIQTEVNDSYFRQGNLAFAFGVFFSQKHKLLNEVGVHWIDSSRTTTVLGGGVFNPDDLDLAYSADIYSRYTFNNLDSVMLPIKGFFAEVMLLGGIPLTREIPVEPFEILSLQGTAAIQGTNRFSIIINGFFGTNFSQTLSDKLELITKYGFTTYDRTFFPHVMQRYTYGIHKIAFNVDTQFQPFGSLTVLGGQFFLGAGAAVGTVFNDYNSIVAINNIEWQSSAFVGLRITRSIGLSLRGGVGNYATGLAPFIALDFMVKHY